MKPEAALDPSQAGRLIPRAALEGRVDRFLLNRVDPSRQEFIVREVTPGLTWNRLDLAIKLYYLEQSEADGSSFAEELYDAHIRAFSLGDFREPGKESKTDAASFRTAFRDILDDLRRTGFDPEKSLIPAASDGSLINGGHRAACALFLGHKVHVVETGLPPVRYDYRFFRNRGMDEHLLEAAIMRYAERSPGARIALLWPSAVTPSEVEKHLGPLAYRKQVRLSAKGLTNLVGSLATDPDYSLPQPPGGPTTASRPLVYVFESNERTHGSTWEAKLREQARKDGHVLHLAATREEGLNLAKVLLNERSVRYLNVASPDRYPGTADLAREFRDVLGRAGVPRDDVILGPGMVLAAFGARATSAVDMMAFRPIEATCVPAAITLTPSPKDFQDILQDPRRHFHAWGLKFLSVGEALKLLQREATLAAEDLRLLARLLPQAEPRHPVRQLLGTVRLHYSRVRRTAIRTVVELGLRKQVSALYDALRGRRS